MCKFIKFIILYFSFAGGVLALEKVNELTNYQFASNHVPALLRPVLQYQQIDFNRPILDIGCGTGDIAEYLVENGARQIVGVDKDSLILKRAAQKAQDGDYEQIVSYINDDFFQLKKKKVLPSDLGTVIAVNVFQYWPAKKIETALKLMYEDLDKNGTAIIAIQNPLVAVDSNNRRFYEEKYNKLQQALYDNTLVKDKIKLNDGIKKFFDEIKHEYVGYQVTPSTYLYKTYERLPLYPFEVIKQYRSGAETQSDSIFHFLFPENMKVLLERAGFKNSKLYWVPDKSDTFLLVAKKLV